jgi:hypothetical protein
MSEPLNDNIDSIYTSTVRLTVREVYNCALPIAHFKCYHRVADPSET